MSCEGHRHRAHDRRPVLGRIGGLVVGHVSPEAFLGGPIALLQDGDTITVDLNTDRLDCRELDDRETLRERSRMWESTVAANGGSHPDAPVVTSRVLQRFRATATPALRGAGVTND